jgi:hypothetical protein
VVAVGERRVTASNQDRFELHQYDSAGALAQVLRVVQPLIIPDRARFVENGLSETAPLPETLPAFSNILVDSDERLWVQEYVPSYESRAPIWWVFDVDGGFIARATLPNRFTPHHIGTDYVLGVSQGDFDEEYVERRKIIREGPE